MNEDNYHLAQNGQNTGPFTLEQVRAMWRSGSLSPQTLYWQPNQADWQPLGQIASTLGAPPTLPGTPPQPMPVAGPDYSTHPAWPGQPVTSGVAIASFVLGLASLLLSVFTAVPAIICGHIALSQIKHSAGRLGGRGFAITGLVIGYLFVGFTVAIFVFFFGALIALPGFKATNLFTQATRDLARAKQVGLAIKLYEGDHNDQTPPDLDALLPTYLSDRSLLTHSTMGNEDGPAFDYLLPNTKVDGMDGHTPLLRARFTSMNHQRIYVYLDDSTELKREP